AEMRPLPAGIDQRSPARHPDWLGPDDLSLKIQEVREATNYEIPIQLKLGAARVYDDVRMAAKCGPDVIYLDGAEGGTGAGPHVAAEETGIPLLAAIPEARRALEDVGLVDEIDLVVAGGIRNGGDVAKCLALGAKAVALGHSALMALNCNKEIPGVTDYEGTVGVPAGKCFAYQEDSSLVEDVDLLAATPGPDINWLEDVTLLEEEGVPAVFDRHSNSFVRIHFPIPEGREDEIARKVLITHLRAGNSY